MIWLPLLLLAPFLGFQCPIIQAAYTVDAPYRNHLHNFPNSRSAANGHRRNNHGSDYVSAARNTDDLGDYYNSQEDSREMSSSDYYNGNAPGGLNEEPVHSQASIKKMLRMIKMGMGDMDPSENQGRRSRINDQPRFNDVMPQSLPFSALGVAIIHSHKLGVICSGSHLKSWILLTTADCVYRKYPEDLYAQIIKWEGKNSMPVTFNVKVDFYVTHPGYRYTDYKSHNLAILVLRGQSNWNVEEFGIPKTPKGKDFKPENLVTYVNEWNELRTPRNKTYLLSIERKFISTNFTTCNSEKPNNSFFCVSDGYNHDVYEQIDVGIPLFYREGASKVLLGIYSGEDLNDGVMGHMFLSIYDNLFWVAEKVLEYPLPPAVN